MADKDAHVIFEIKSSDDYVDGLLKIGGYLELLDYLDPLATWTVGDASQYLPTPSITVAGFEVLVTPPMFGVITYYVPPVSLKAINNAIASVGELEVGFLVSQVSVSGVSGVSGGFL